MGARIGDKAWAPEIIKYMKLARESGDCFDQIGADVFAKFGMAVSGRTIAIKLRSLGLIAPPVGGGMRKPYKKPTPPPVEIITHLPRNACRFADDRGGYCGKPRTNYSMDFCSAHYRASGAAP